MHDGLCTHHDHRWIISDLAYRNWFSSNLWICVGCKLQQSSPQHVVSKPQTLNYHWLQCFLCIDKSFFFFFKEHQTLIFCSINHNCRGFKLLEKIYDLCLKDSSPYNQKDFFLLNVLAIHRKNSTAGKREN